MADSDGFTGGTIAHCELEATGHVDAFDFHPSDVDATPKATEDVEGVTIRAVPY